MDWEAFLVDFSAPFFPSSKNAHWSLVEKLCNVVPVVNPVIDPVVDPVVSPVPDPLVELPDASINNVLVPNDKSVELHNLADAGLTAIEVDAICQVVDTSNEPEDVVNLNVSVENLVLLQKKDKSIAHLYERLNAEDENVKYFINSNNISCREFIRDNLESVIQIIVPYKLRTELLKLAHDIASSGHLGVVKTKDRLLLVGFYWHRLLLVGFYWHSIGKNVAYYCKTCNVCQRTNKSCVKYKAQMLKPPVIDQPFYRISIDILSVQLLSLLKRVLCLF